MTECYADLHLHTTASDGTQTVSELAARARGVGLSIIAITDHDTISPDLTAPTTKINGIEVITGVELKVLYDGIHGELLGYFIDPHSSALTELFSFMRAAREKRMEEMISRCRNYTDADITIAAVRALAKGSIGRPHLAQTLVDRGVVTTKREAFDKLLGNGKPCYVALEKPDFRAAARAIHAAGGVTSIPHPCLFDVPDWDSFLAYVKPEGVDGVEVFYAYDRPNELTADPQEIMLLARKHGFLLTGGSDDHGPGSVRESLGRIRVPCKYVEQLRASARA